jgi:hypothetical protein
LSQCHLHIKTWEQFFKCRELCLPFPKGNSHFFYLKWHFCPNVQFIEISIPLPTITITFKFSNSFLFLPTHKFLFSGATCQSN